VDSSLPSATSGAELTCYAFGQGTYNSTCPASSFSSYNYKTQCGYCGMETGTTGTDVSDCFDGTTDNVAYISTGTYFAAFPTGSFGNGTYCGMCVAISYMGTTEIATIIDVCPGCATGHLDLGPSLAQKLGLAQGKNPGDPMSGVTWEAVSCPVTGDIVAVFNDPSQVYLQNARYPITSVSGASQQSPTYWQFGGNAAGNTVTIGDAGGHSVVGTCTIPSTSGGSLGCQFAAPSSCTAPP
jgi:expansin (peptidoglycan-binding protein)